MWPFSHAPRLTAHGGLLNSFVMLLYCLKCCLSHSWLHSRDYLHLEGSLLGPVVLSCSPHLWLELCPPQSKKCPLSADCPTGGCQR